MYVEEIEKHLMRTPQGKIKFRDPFLQRKAKEAQNAIWARNEALCSDICTNSESAFRHGKKLIEMAKTGNKNAIYNLFLITVQMTQGINDLLKDYDSIIQGEELLMANFQDGELAEKSSDSDEFKEEREMSSDELRLIELAKDLMHLAIREKAREETLSIARSFLTWPILLNVMEIPKRDFWKTKIADLELGQNAPFCFVVGSGKGSDFSGGQSRLAYDTWQGLQSYVMAAASEKHELECDSEEYDRAYYRTRIDLFRSIREPEMLPEISNDPNVIARWSDVGVKYWGHLCLEKWDEYEWPDCVRGRMRVSKNGNSRYAPSSLRQILKSGFSSIVK